MISVSIWPKRADTGRTRLPAKTPWLLTILHACGIAIESFYFPSSRLPDRTIESTKLFRCCSTPGSLAFCSCRSYALAIFIRALASPSLPAQNKFWICAVISMRSAGVRGTNAFVFSRFFVEEKLSSSCSERRPGSRPSEVCFCCSFFRSASPVEASGSSGSPFSIQSTIHSSIVMPRSMQ